MAVIKKLKEIEARHKKGGNDFEYTRHTIVPRSDPGKLVAAFNTIPPGKSTCPYHYHADTDEIFYIISGIADVRTPKGISRVESGDVLYFPAGEDGAHRITNASETENLVYIDIDTKNKSDICVYPDSGKIGVWGENTNKIFMLSDDVGYYEGE